MLHFPLLEIGTELHLYMSWIKNWKTQLSLLSYPLLVLVGQAMFFSLLSSKH